MDDAVDWFSQNHNAVREEALQLSRELATNDGKQVGLRAHHNVPFELILAERLLEKADLPWMR